MQSIATKIVNSLSFYSTAERARLQDPKKQTQRITAVVMITLQKKGTESEDDSLDTVR